MVSRTRASRSSKASTTSPTVPTPATGSGSPWPRPPTFSPSSASASSRRLTTATRSCFPRGSATATSASTGRTRRSARGRSGSATHPTGPLGRLAVVMKPVQYHWDEMKIGPALRRSRPVKGWLSIYHGVFPTMDGAVYRLGVALHRLDDPAQILGVCDRWILQPEDPWRWSATSTTSSSRVGLSRGRWHAEALLGRRRQSHVRRHRRHRRTGGRLPDLRPPADVVSQRRMGGFSEEIP